MLFLAHWSGAFIYQQRGVFGLWYRLIYASWIFCEVYNLGISLRHTSRLINVANFLISKEDKTQMI